MDLIDELTLIKSNRIDSAIIHVKHQKKIWEQKLHVLNVFNLINELEELVKNNVFEKYGVIYLRIYSSMHYTGNNIKYEICNEFYKKCIIENDLMFQNLENKFFQFDGFSSENINGGFDLFFNIKGNLKEHIFEHLLSEELKNILEYSEMHINVQKKEKSINKKFKI